MGHYFFCVTPFCVSLNSMQSTFVSSSTFTMQIAKDVERGQRQVSLNRIDGLQPGDKMWINKNYPTQELVEIASLLDQLVCVLTWKRSLLWSRWLFGAEYWESTHVCATQFSSSLSFACCLCPPAPHSDHTSRPKFTARAQGWRASNQHDNGNAKQ